MKTTNMYDLFVTKLQHLYDTEKQITKMLPRMIRKATEPELVRALTEHLELTQNQAQRLEEVFKEIGQPIKAKKSAAMLGLLEQGREVFTMKAEDSVMDAAIIAAAQSVEHHEMTGYGTARTWARQLGFDEVAAALERTLEEERQTDEILNSIAESLVNPSAIMAQGRLQWNQG